MLESQVPLAIAKPASRVVRASSELFHEFLQSAHLPPYSYKTIVKAPLVGLRKRGVGALKSTHAKVSSRTLRISLAFLDFTAKSWLGKRLAWQTV